MADNETRIRITAVDDATATLNRIKGAAGELSGTFTRLQGAFAALAAIGPIAGLAASVSSAIKTAAAMEELSQKTGIATEKLSALDYAMRREGVSTEAFAKGMKELSKNMVEAGDASSKAGKLFAELGVNTRGDTREALLKIADTFAALPDGATKAALAVQLFGKAGMDLIPALNNGAAGIAKIEEQARRLGITLTTETGKAAKEFADNIFAVQESSKALGVTIANQTLPNLVRVSQAMREAAENGGLLKAAWVGLGGLAAEALGLNETEAEAGRRRIRELQAAIAEAQATVARGGKDLGNGVIDRSEVVKATEEVRRLKAELASAQTLADAQAGKFADAVDRRLAQGKSLTPSNESAIRKILAGGEVKAAIDTFGKELDALQVKLEATSQGFGQDFPKSVGILNAALATGRISLEKHAELMGILISQQPAYKAGLKAQEELQQSITKALADGLEARRRYIAGIEQEIARQQFANETTGMTEEQIASLTVARLEENLAILQASGAMEDETAALQEEIDLRKKLAVELGKGEQIRQQQIRDAEELRNQVGAWDDLSSRGARFFYDLALSGKDAFASLKQSLKSFAAEMVALFAKKYILQLGAQLSGNSSLSSLAGSTGQGSLAGTLLSSGGSLLAEGLAGIGLSSASQFVGGATGAIAGPALEGSALAAGQTFGGYLAAAGPYVAAILAAYALYTAFKDKGENWKGRLGFGDMANAYSTNGVFGREGFQYLAGDDALNRSIQAFFSSTRPLDEQIARRLTSAQRASITGRLSAYNTSGVRSDGQPAEFAFGKGDDTAAAQLTLEYLKQKYGAIFDEIDGEFASFIRGYTGKSEDLLKAIGDFATVLDNLDALGIPGLNLEALKGFKKEGEELGATLSRIAQQFSTYQELFLTDSEKLALLQKSVAQGFADLGIEVPKTNEEFKRLIEGLDLSTEAGRTLFEGLMKLAPGFAAVSNAAGQLLASFKQIASQRNPALARTFLEADLEETVRQFMERNPWTRGMDWRTVAQQIGLITSYAGGYGDFQRYSSEDQALILKILGITGELEGLGDAASGAASALGGMQDNARAAANSWLDIKLGLWNFLRGLYTSNEFSPLDPTQRLDTLKTRFTTTLAQANSGNIEAGQSLSGIIEEILRAGRENFGSGPGYVDLFNWVTGLAGDFVQPGGGMELQRLAFEEAKAQTKTLKDIAALLIAIRDQGPESAAMVADASVESAGTLSSAIKVASLATARR